MNFSVSTSHDIWFDFTLEAGKASKIKYASFRLPFIGELWVEWGNKPNRSKENIRPFWFDCWKEAAGYYMADIYGGVLTVQCLAWKHCKEG